MPIGASVLSYRYLSVAALCLLLFTGCNSDRVRTYPVSGKVQFEDGEAVRWGVIEAESEFGTTATGAIQEDGTFILGTYSSDDGAAEGVHNVVVMQMTSADMLQQHEKDHGLPVDPRFASYDTSSLKIEVKPVEQNQVTIIVTPQ